MKLNGIVGKGSGRLGSSVFTVRGGEQIVRQYTPNVANPNTDKQQGQRAKFKLLSQMGAIAADGLLFPKVGNVSQRNAFVQANMAAVTFADGRASLDLSNLSLGNGHGAVTVLRTDIAGEDRVSLTIVDEDWVGMAYATVDFVEQGRVVGISGILKGREGVIPVIGARMAKTQVVVAAFRYRDGAARAKYGNIVTEELGQTGRRVSLRISELIANGDIVVSQTVIAAKGE